MIDIFRQIKRFENIELQEGETFSFTLPVNTQNQVNKESLGIDNKIYTQPQKMQINGKYKITVKSYMTEPATSTFDFQDKWNKGIPMPMVTMIGTVIKETRGMFYMELHGQAEPTCNCLHCGRSLTNKVSMLYGIGPICGEHYGINPFDTEEELNEHFEELKKKISEIKWEGWVIKSAIKEYTELKGDD